MTREDNDVDGVCAKVLMLSTEDAKQALIDAVAWIELLVCDDDCEYADNCVHSECRERILGKLLENTHDRHKFYC